MRPQVKAPSSWQPAPNLCVILPPLCPRQLASDLLTSFFLSPGLAQWLTMSAISHYLLSEQQEWIFSQWE